MTNEIKPEKDEPVTALDLILASATIMMAVCLFGSILIWIFFQ